MCWFGGGSKKTRRQEGEKSGQYIHSLDIDPAIFAALFLGDPFDPDSFASIDSVSTTPAMCFVSAAVRRIAACARERSVRRRRR